MKESELIFLIIKTHGGSHRINLDHLEDYYPTGIDQCQIRLASGKIIDVPEPVEYLDELIMGRQSVDFDEEEKNSAH